MRRVVHAAQVAGVGRVAGAPGPGGGGGRRPAGGGRRPPAAPRARRGRNSAHTRNLRCMHDAPQDV
ncbi:MAG: hypothetical protein L6414_10850, partial [Hydrogenophaga sp.]